MPDKRRPLHLAELDPDNLGIHPARLQRFSEKLLEIALRGESSIPPPAIFMAYLSVTVSLGVRRDSAAGVAAVLRRFALELERNPEVASEH
jgi:hypothetical protein